MRRDEAAREAYVSIRQHTSASVSIRQQGRASAPWRYTSQKVKLASGTQFTCFTGTKVLILTLRIPVKGEVGERAKNELQRLHGPTTRVPLEKRKRN